MSRPEEHDGSEALRQQLRSAVDQASISPALRRRKLVLWGVRQILLCALAWYFWDRTWMQWLFGIGVTIAIIHLVMILYMPAYLRRMRRRSEAAMAQLETFREESEGKYGE